jgi:hypothetical protein
MRFDGRLVAIVAMSCVCVVPPRRVAADEWNKRTVVTFNEPSTGAPYRSRRGFIRAVPRAKNASTRSAAVGDRHVGSI